jgi:hypothetical protein
MPPNPTDPCSSMPSLVNHINPELLTTAEVALASARGGRGLPARNGASGGEAAVVARSWRATPGADGGGPPS